MAFHSGSTCCAIEIQIQVQCTCSQKAKNQKAKQTIVQRTTEQYNTRQEMK